MLTEFSRENSRTPEPAEVTKKSIKLKGFFMYE